MVATQPTITMVTGKINDVEVTVPAGTNLLDAARQVGVEIPNLCFQPKLRAWGSCRICTVEVLGSRGGLIEGCATPLTEGMEVRTHTPEVEQARQFILQMYLIDHALDCPTCDASGQCYLQDNTYLHNINANPYRRPKMAHSYEHFSSTIDYKWDRCIMCARCTRVCDEVIGVTAIESANRALEATITPAYGLDLSETTCTNCGMCIASCPVGALTDRHFAHHPWEVDTTETVCGGCDGGCTINLETNRGVVRRVSHLWDRGVNFGYTCQYGKWGHELLQSPDRLQQPLVRNATGELFATDWDDAIERIVAGLEHFQGDRFAALASPDQTTEEAYLLQQFTRAVMGTNNIDMYASRAQQAVAAATESGLGVAVSGTNSLQELFTDVRSALLVGPDINKTTPIAAYWLNHARIYREAKLVIVSTDRSTMTDRADVWLQPRPGSTADVLLGIAAIIEAEGWSATPAGGRKHIDPRLVADASGVDLDQMRRAARIYAFGGTGTSKSPSVIYQTAARAGAPTKIGGGYADRYSPGEIGDRIDDAGAIAAACAVLAEMTGNLGVAGGGIMSPRGGANVQGLADAGARPLHLPGGVLVSDEGARATFEATWTPRWAERANTSNGFVPVRHLPTGHGLSATELPDAIARGEVRALYIEGTLDGGNEVLDPRLMAVLPRLELLVVAEVFASPLTDLAHIILPLATSIEKDGTFTSFDRTVQRVRAAVPAPGNARSSFEIVQQLARRFGYDMTYRHPSQVMAELARLTQLYSGIAYARLERSGMTVPSSGRVGVGLTVLPLATDELSGPLSLRPR
jgi:predicted molibdopterin-dependent oxidoreductase YjgC